MRGVFTIYYEYVAIFYHCCYVDIANQLRRLLHIAVAVAVGLCEFIQPSIMRRNSSFKRLLLLWYSNICAI